MKILSNKYYPAALLFALLFAAGIVFAQSNISFPVAELGNCGSKSECRAYCDLDGPFAEEMSDSVRAERREACSDFASSRGIKKPKHDAGKFEVVKEDGGPDGKCGKSADPIGACSSLCDSSENISICIDYAKKHNLFDGKELEEAEKVAGALSRGVKLPAACKNADSCKATCDDPQDLETARQCFTFAESAGLLPPGFDKEKAEKFFQSFRDGKGPFKNFKEMRQCDRPQDRETVNKCADFAEQNGFITANEAKMMRATGGKGPGGCQGEECKTYCDSDEHQDECMKFAEEHDLMKPEDKERMQKGMEQFRESMQNAPEEVQACIKSSIGEEALSKLLSGAGRPTRDIGEKMRSCFDNFFSSRDSDEGEDGDFRGFQREQGDDQGMGREEFETINNRDFRGDRREVERVVKGTERMQRNDPRMPQFPPEVLECLKTKMSEGDLENMMRPTRPPSSQVEGTMRACFEEFGRSTRHPPPEAGNRRMDAGEGGRPAPMPDRRMDFENNRPLNNDDIRQSGDTDSRMMPGSEEFGNRQPAGTQNFDRIIPGETTQIPVNESFDSAREGPIETSSTIETTSFTPPPEQTVSPLPPTSMSKTRNAASAFAPLLLFFFGR